MIGLFDGAVNSAAVGPEIGRGKKLVDAEEHFIAVVTEAEAVPAQCVGILQQSGHAIVSVADGRVVEIATDDDRPGSVACTQGSLDVAGEAVRLDGALGIGIAQLLYQSLCTCRGNTFPGIVEDVLIVALVIIVQTETLQVAVEQRDRVALYIQRVAGIAVPSVRKRDVP